MNSDELWSQKNFFSTYPTFSSLCDKDSWYFFRPSSTPHRLKCCLNVTLEREGKEDISSSYQWESKKLDWFSASNTDQIQLNEVAFRLKLSTWRHRNPFFRPRPEIPELNYHWIRPGYEREDDSDTFSNEKEEKSKLKRSILNFVQFHKKIHPDTLFFLLFIFISILALICFFPKLQLNAVF